MDETQNRHAIIDVSFPLMGQRKNELGKTAHAHAPRNECGNSERAGASERTGNAYSPAIIIITPATLLSLPPAPPTPRGRGTI